MRQYDRVRLCNNLYIEEGLFKGDVGYILEVYNDGKFEVEFSKRDTGETIALIVVDENDIELAE